MKSIEHGCQDVFLLHSVNLKVKKCDGGNVE